MSLVDIQQKIKAPKNQRNDFGKYNYRSCEDILEAVKPLLGDCILTISDEIIQIGERYYVRAVVTLQDGEAKHVVTAYAREEETKKGMDAAQITGAASSYARKYALNGLFLIDDTKDADATNKHGKSEADPLGIPPKDSRLTLAKPKSKAEALNQIIEAKGDESKACKWASDYFQRDIKKLDSITKEELWLLWKELFKEAA
jgi:hypothetical protein